MNFLGRTGERVRIYKKDKPLVFFNASVIIAGLISPSGWSAKVLSFVKEGKVKGRISEVVLDEILRHSDKVGFSRGEIVKRVKAFNLKIVNAPEKLDILFKEIVIDVGDVHVLTSAKISGSDYLVSLDKKHLLVLKGKVENFEILTPGELIAKLR